MRTDSKITRAIIVPAGMAALLLAGVGCSKPQAKPAEEKVRAVPVRTATVVQRPMQETVVLTGTLKPLAQVQLVSEVSARLLTLRKQEGDFVSKGEVVAALDSTDYNLSLQRASAARQSAEANRSHAEAERLRAENLIKTGGITDKDNLAAQVNLQVAEASLSQAKAEEAIARQQVSKCQIRAPFSGRVARKHVDAGAMLSPGTPVVTIMDSSAMEFRAQVPSADFGKVRVGAAVEVTVDAMPGTTMKGKVERITPLVDERSRSFEVVVHVPQPKEMIAGLFARGAIHVREIADALIVPPAALQRDGVNPELARTYVINGGKAERIEVGVGIEASDAVQVTRGLKKDSVVVVDPPVALSSGSTVEIQSAANENNQQPASMPR
jgi:RND family efflux transporter MFP subunit